MLRLSQIFGDNLGIEIQAHNLNRPANYFSEPINQIFTNEHLIRLANKNNLRIVATTNSHYIKNQIRKFTMLCLQSDQCSQYILMQD